MNRKPKKTAMEMLEEQAAQGRPEARFMLYGLKRQAAMGGAPIAAWDAELGAIVFTYPNGVKTSGGVRIN